MIPPFRGLLPLLGFLAAWQLVAAETSPRFPPPSTWWKAVWLLASNGTLLPAVIATLWTFFLGLAAAAVWGFFLGLLIGTVEPLRRWSSMLLEFLRALPPPVIIPIAVLMLGYSDTLKVGVVAITAAWPILLNTVTGVAGINRLLLDVARSHRMSWRERLFAVVIPATIPSFLIGLRIAIALAIVITLLVEMFTGLPGVGLLMILGQRNFDSAQVFGLLAVVGVLAFALTLGFSLAEGKILKRWPPRYAAR